MLGKNVTEKQDHREIFYNDCFGIWHASIWDFQST